MAVVPAPFVANRRIFAPRGGQSAPAQSDYLATASNVHELRSEKTGIPVNNAAGGKNALRQRIRFPAMNAQECRRAAYYF
jgi:hypothetical protein